MIRIIPLIWIWLGIYGCISNVIFDIHIHVADAQVITGGAGYALQFNGVSFGSVSSSCSSFNPFAVSSVTLETWFNLAGDKRELSNDRRTAASENSHATVSLMGSAWEGGYELQYDYLKNKIRFQTQGPGFANECWSSESYDILPDQLYGRWRHVAAIWNSETQVKQILLDGELIFNRTCPGGTLSVSATSFFVGGTFTIQGLSMTSISPFYGALDETRLWKVARTQQQIKEYMNRSIPRSLFSSLITYFNFDEGSGLTAIDVAHVDNLLVSFSASLGNGQLAWAPTYIPSEANIITEGEVQITQIRTTPTPTAGAGPAAAAAGNINSTILSIPYLNPVTREYTTVASNPQSPVATVTIVGISDPRYLSYFRGPGDVAVALDQPFGEISIQPIHTIAPHTINNMVNIDYIIQVGNDRSNISRASINILANSPPVIGSSGYTLQCDGDNDYAVASSFRWNTSSAVTVTVWALTYPDDVQHSALFSVGNSEVVGQWCPDNPTGEPTRCQGRFMAHVPWWDKKLGFHYGWVPGERGAVQVDITPRLGQWTHWAMVSDGRDGVTNNGTARVYANGVLIGSVPSDSPIGEDLVGLTLCDWRYAGPRPHQGQMDDFRIWNRALSLEEINQRMYQSDDIGIGKVPPPGLMVAYDFNEDPSIPYAIDISGHGHDAIFGGCQSSETIKPPYFHSGLPHCGQPGVPLQNVDYYPSRVIARDTINAGYQFHTIFPVSSTQVRIMLNGSDPDGDRLAAQLTQLPTRGILLHYKDKHILTMDELLWQDISSRTITVWMNISVGSGGYPYTTLSYILTDGILTSNTATVVIDVPCGPGYYLNNDAKLCVACPSGTYQPSPSTYATSCLPVPIGAYQSSRGQSTYLNCSTQDQTFSDVMGAIACKTCSEYDYPTPCIMPANLHPKAYTALTVICIIELCIVGIVLCVVIWQRSSRIIYSASTLFTSLSLVGCLGLLTSVMLLIQVQTSSLCAVKHWMFHLSFDVAFLSLFAKTRRLDSIFNSNVLDSKNRAVTDRQLLANMAIYIIYDIIILAVWTGQNPMSINNPIEHECISENHLIYQFLLLIPKFVIVLLILVVAYRVRLIPTLFNECIALYFSMANIGLASLIVFLLAVTANMLLRSEKVVVAVAIMYGVGITVAALMGPKLYQLQATRPRQRQQRESHAIQTNTSNKHAHSRMKSGSMDHNKNVSSSGTPAAGTVSPGLGPSTGSGVVGPAVIGGVTCIVRPSSASVSLGRSSHRVDDTDVLSSAKLSTYSMDGIQGMMNEKRRKYRELTISIQHTREKLTALELHAQLTASNLHVLTLETEYRLATGTGTETGTGTGTGQLDELQTNLASSTPAEHRTTRGVRRNHRVGSTSSAGPTSASVPPHSPPLQKNTTGHHIKGSLEFTTDFNDMTMDIIDKDVDIQSAINPSPVQTTGTRTGTETETGIDVSHHHDDVTRKTRVRLEDVRVEMPSTISELSGGTSSTSTCAAPAPAPAPAPPATATSSNDTPVTVTVSSTPDHDIDTAAADANTASGNGNGNRNRNRSGSAARNHI